MKKILAEMAAWIAYQVANYAAAKLSYEWFVRNLGRLIGLVERFKPGDQLITVLGDARKIFENKDSSALARRLIRESRPEQFKAVVRGGIL